MADRFTQEPRVEASVTIRLTEVEAAALAALFCYDMKRFLTVFYDCMGESYLKPHEVGLLSLSAAVNKELPQFLHNVDRARKVFNEKLRQE